MSDYYEQSSRRKSTRSTRDRDDYDSGRGGGGGGRADAGSLVRRRDDSVSSVDEEITRDFPPGERGGAYYRETTVRKSGHRPVRTRSFGDYDRDDRHNDRSSYASTRRNDDYASSKKSSRGYDDRYDDRRSVRRTSRRQASSSSSSESRSPPRKERRKSMIEEGIGALGLGGLVGAITGKKSRSRSRSRDRGGRGRARSASSDRYRSRSRGGGRSRSRNKSTGKEQISQAIKAALLAGAGEAFRARKEPGGWGGDKGKRVLTAAISAGGVDTLISNKRDPDKHGARDVIGSALAGLATNRIVNGSRSKSRGLDNASPGGRARSESRGRGLGDLAAAGGIAGLAKMGYDKFRSKSRGRDRSRSVSSSGSSYDSRSPPPRNKRRSQSVSGYAARGLAAVGFKGAADRVDPERRRSTRYDDGNGYDDYGNGGSRDVGRNGPPDHDMAVSTAKKYSGTERPNGYALDYHPHHTGDPDTDSDSSLGSSSGEEKEVKKGRRKGLITAGLATVATIHAGHSVYQSYEKRQERKKEVRAGEISVEEAKKLKNKGRLQDAAAIGIAALGIKGAYSEWQEMREHNHEMNETREKLERHKTKRENRRRKIEKEALMYQDSGYTASMPNLHSYPGPGPATHRYDPPAPTPSYSQAAAPTQYYDDNPYGGGAPVQPKYDAGFPPPPPGPPPPTNGGYR